MEGGGIVPGELEVGSTVKPSLHGIGGGWCPVMDKGGT
jgi:hypothetical protein